MNFNRIEELPSSGKGIYIIRNKINNKFYIGSTTENFRRRALHHRCCLRGDYHTNQHLQNAWNKYGEENFEFLIKKIVDNLDKIISTEQALLDQYNKIDWSNIYNINKKADKVEFTKEVLSKKSQAMKEKWKDPEFRKKQKENRKDPWNKGKANCYSKETLSKMSKSAKNRKNNNIVEQKRIQAIKNKTSNVEMKRVTGELIGVYDSAEQITKLSKEDEFDLDESELRYISGQRSSSELQAQSIRSVCNGNKNSYKGFIFKYVN